MTNAEMNRLEMAASRAQEHARLAWIDLQSDLADECQESWDAANDRYENAKAEQDRTYAAWKAAQPA